MKRLKGNVKILTKTTPDKIHFYMYNHLIGEVYLFSENYIPEVYRYFRKMRSIKEIYGFHGWGGNRNLDRIIKRIPVMIRFILREYVDHPEVCMA